VVNHTTMLVKTVSRLVRLFKHVSVFWKIRVTKKVFRNPCNTV